MACLPQRGAGLRGRELLLGEVREILRSKLYCGSTAAAKKKAVIGFAVSDPG
jgi:hypothetical protein